MADSVFLSGAVEGLLDEAILRRLVEQEGATLKPPYGKTGKSILRKLINGYNQAAHFPPWVVLVDLDRDNDCAPDLKAEWLPEPAPHMCFRVAVRAVEVWLLADRESLAKFLSVNISQLPLHPETRYDRVGKTLAPSGNSREHGAATRKWSQDWVGVYIANDRVRSNPVETGGGRA